MKKVLCVLVSALFVVGAFSGCAGAGNSQPTEAAPSASAQSGEASGSEAATPGAEEISFWSLFSGGDGDYMDEIIQKYNETNPAMPVKATRLNWDEYYTKLMTAVSANNGPDIGASHTSRLPELVDQGAVMALDPYAEAAQLDWSLYNQNVLEATVMNGNHYAVPIDTHAQVMFYNKALCKDADVLNEDGTLKVAAGKEGWNSLMKTLQANLPEKVIPLAMSQAGYEPWRLWWGLYYQLGGTQMINDASTEVTMDNAKAIEAAALMKSLFDEGYIAPNIEDHFKFFQTSGSALFIGGVWGTAVFEETEGLDLGSMPLPTIFDKSACWADSHTFVLPTQKNPDEARMQNAVSFMEFATREGALWAQAGHIPARNDVIESEAYKVLPYRADYAIAAETAAFTPKSAVNAAAKEIMVQNLDLIWNGSLTPEAGIEKMAGELSSVF